MGWNKGIKVDKGYLRGKVFTYNNITGKLPFADSTSPYNNIPTVGDDEHGDFNSFIGYHIENFGQVVADLGEGSNMLLAAWNVNPQGGESGAYLCLLIDISNWSATVDNISVRVTIKLVKRLYDYAGTSYTESYPVGTYFQSSDYTLWSRVSPDNRQGDEFAVFFKEATYNSVSNYVVGMAQLRRNGYAYCYGQSRAYRMTKAFFNSSDGWGSNADIPEEIDESPEYGPASRPGGGYNEDSEHKGSFDDSSDTITVDPAPTKSVLTTNFVHQYVVEGSDLDHLADALFSQFDWTTVDIPSYLKNLSEAIINNKRIDFILDFLIIPVVPTTEVNKRYISCGGHPLQWTDSQGFFQYVEGYPVSNAYVDWDCGSIEIPEYWANFLDFTGTRFKLFLPYIGYVDIQPEYVNGGTLNVKYRFNTLDGSFMAYVSSSSGHSELTDSLIGQYAGVAAIHIPLQSNDYSNKVSGLIASIGSVAAAAMTGGIGASVIGGASLANTLIQKPGTSSSNGYNASSSYLSHRTPYLIIERQSSQFSEKYPEEVGLPLNVAMRLGDCTGLTVATTAHLDTIPATKEEKELISQYLKDGVIL